jgi:tRNA A58 N-methylase Trm61
MRNRDRMEHDPVTFEQGQRNDSEYIAMLKETLGVCLRFSKNALRVLEFGAGTGLLSEFLVPNFRQAEIVISEPDFRFLNLAIEKFKNHKNIIGNKKPVLKFDGFFYNYWIIFWASS